MSRKVVKRPPARTAITSRDDRRMTIPTAVHQARPNESEAVGWRPVAGICAGLVALVFVVFGQTIHFHFLNFDDQDYIYDNPVVLKGLTAGGIGWAFTHAHADNWHPLTTILHMLDCQVYGLWAGGHHLTNVVLHSACAVLLFLMLLDMTRALWRGAFVAALFAIHPLRVESVAWVSELKDVLSGLFFMLTLWAYARYARGPRSRARYAAVVLCLALGLLSKPMLVTVPFVLLLLDYWPLGRLRTVSQLPGLLTEKLPLFALCVLSSIATIIAQRQAIAPDSKLALSSRLGNALVACVVYLEKLVWPSGLAALYPFPTNGPEGWEVIDAILILAALSAGAWLLRRKKPYLLGGWLWYLGMLAPVIGIVQVGPQAYADRYTYLPQIGLCIAATWAAADWAGERRARRAGLGAVALAILCALLVASWRQTTYWRDSETLWTHALECTENNWIAHGNLGLALYDTGRVDQAIAQYGDDLAINPADEKVHSNLGNALAREGRIGDALAEYREALRLNPDDAEARYNLGSTLCRQGRMDDGIAEYREALRINPAYAEAHGNLGTALLQERRIEEAISEYREAIRIDPGYADAHSNLGVALLQQGRTEEAIAEYREALRINPAYADAQCNLGLALCKDGQAGEGIARLDKAIQLQPANPVFQFKMAWLLATAPQPSLRNGARAVQLATQANLASGGADAGILHCLAAAYAQAGRFPDAVKAAQKALQLAGTGSNAALAGILPREIKLYEEGKPFEPRQ